LTAFSVTVTNSVNVFGAAPSNKWNAFNWNAFTWGDGTADLSVQVVKGITNDLTTDSGINYLFVKGLSNTLSFDIDMRSEALYDSAGYFYVFTDRTTAGESRVFTTWASAAVTTLSWSASSTTSTSWS
jgi:hypothetical protein